MFHEYGINIYICSPLTPSRISVLCYLLADQVLLIHILWPSFHILNAVTKVTNTWVTVMTSCFSLYWTTPELALQWSLRRHRAWGKYPLHNHTFTSQTFPVENTWYNIYHAITLQVRLCHWSHGIKPFLKGVWKVCTQSWRRDNICRLFTDLDISINESTRTCIARILRD